MTTLYRFYNTYWNEYADQRMLDYPLLGSPVPVLVILGLYWLAIKKGPQWMARRPAYEIKMVIQAYNVFQIVVCAYIVVKGCVVLSQRSFRCLVHNTNSPYDSLCIFYSWVYFVIKLVDLLDTMFFIARKRFSLVTTLHTYHHTLMVVASFLYTRYAPAGEMCLMAWLNCLVHAVMYFYYFYCLHCDSKANIWWKKYITQMQLAQFCIVFCVFAYKVLFVHDCGYPKSLMVFGMVQAIVFINMFGNYYYNTFVKEKIPEGNGNVLGVKKAF